MVAGPYGANMATSYAMRKRQQKEEKGHWQRKYCAQVTRIYKPDASHEDISTCCINVSHKTT
jgi:hypothetical protein